MPDASRPGGRGVLRVLGEFLLIVAGVTVSLAADDWRQAAADRSRERAILEEIHEDLLDDAEDIESVVTAVERWDHAAQWLNRFAGRSDAPADSIRTAFRVFGIIMFYEPVSSAYASLQAGGELYLISDQDLRRSIVRYYEVRQRYMSGFADLSRDNWRRWYDVSAPYVDRVIVESDSTMFAMIGHQPELLAPWSEIAADPIFMGHVDIMGGLAGNAVIRLNEGLAENQTMRETILATLGR